MAIQFVLYNLKDGVTEEDFLKFVNEYKGPFIAGLSAVKHYTITRVKMAKKAVAGIPEPIDVPYQIAAIVELTSLPDYKKDTESEAYQKEFTPRFGKLVKDLIILQADEIYDIKGQ